MIDAGTAFAAAVAQSSRRFRLRMYDGNNEIAGSVRSAKIHLGSTGPDAFAIGAVYSSYAEIVLDGRETTLEGKELRLDIGVLTDPANNAYAEMTLGYFTALAPAATKYRTTLTACGRIVSKLAVTDFVAPATQTLQAVADAITTQTGVSVVFDSGINTTLVIDTPVTGTCRDALTRLAECVMGYATETNTGTVKIARFAVTPTTTRDAADMVTLPVITDINFEILGVRAVTATGVYETSNAANVQIESNYITEDIFTEFALGLVGIEYRPGTVSLALGDPRIEPSDVLSVTVDSDVYVVPCFSITHIFDGGLQTEIITPSEQAVGKVTGTLSQAVADAKAAATQAAAEVDDAKKVATNYLTRDATGVMVAEMTDHVYTPSNVPAGVLNAFIGGGSFKVRDGQTVLASYGTEAVIYTTDGTELAHFGYAYGNDGQGGTAITPYYTLGRRAANTDIGNYSLAVGYSTEASAYASAAFGNWTRATGNYAVAAGNNSEASGTASAALGSGSEASGNFSVAAGYNATASGNYAVAAGLSVTASGEASVAMGADSEASGDYSTVIGRGLTAVEENQTVIGRWNISDYDGKYLFIIGNGTGGTARLRSTGFAVTTDGNPEMSLASTEQHDADLKNALIRLGWLQELYTDNDKMLSLKALLYKILSQL